MLQFYQHVDLFPAFSASLSLFFVYFRCMLYVCWRILDPNCGSLVLEAPALPTLPQPDQVAFSKLETYLPCRYLPNKY